MSKQGVRLIWRNDEAGYQCPVCSLWVCIPKRDDATCPRCIGTHEAEAWRRGYEPRVEFGWHCLTCEVEGLAPTATAAENLAAAHAKARTRRVMSVSEPSEAAPLAPEVVLATAVGEQLALRRSTAEIAAYALHALAEAGYAVTRAEPDRLCDDCRRDGEPWCGCPDALPVKPAKASEVQEAAQPTAEHPTR